SHKHNRLPIPYRKGETVSCLSWGLFSFDPVTPPSPEGSPLRMVCSEAKIFKMSSWPKDIDKDPLLRVLSPGSPFAIKPITFDVSGRPTAGTTAEALRSAVLGAAEQQGACTNIGY
ncbi:hypothetical protein, partial [Pseudomonas helleri]|uniref:hypothetical protein n=1 Tax=Pseudomonas helleri TaxID=1608996 RepID=UPI001E2FE9B0